MTPKPVIPRARAVHDVEAIMDYYLAEGSERAALGFIDTLERAYGHIGENPSTGSSRYAFELNYPELRCWPLARYPYLVFYVERGDHIDVWRVLHDKRDIATWMQKLPDAGECN